MSRVEVYIEDAEHEMVDVRFAFMGEPFNAGSRAHQLANILRKHCDEILTQAPSEPATVAEAAHADG